MQPSSSNVTVTTLFSKAGTLLRNLPTATLEKSVAFAVVALTLMHMALYAGAMAHGSLWTDELGAVKDFFEPGPWHALTSYPIPRNHVFYSFLNSLLPWAGDIDSFRARFLSYVFAGLLGGSILWSYFRRKLYFEGAIIFALWGLNGELIHLSLQARGYGLLCLFALWSALLTLRYTAEKRRTWFFFLTLCTVLGSYTLPSYAFFGLPLLLLLAWRERDRHAWCFTLGGALALAVLYAPIAPQVIRATAEYAKNYGEYYTGYNSVVKTFHAYFAPLTRGPLTVLVGLVCLLPFIVWPTTHSRRRGTRQLILAAFIFLGVCLYLRTPPVRTTCFIVLPLMVCCGEIAGRIYRSAEHETTRVVLCITLLVSGLVAGTAAIACFHFIPFENWTLTRSFVETMYPRGTLVDCSYAANGLTYYIDQDHYRINLAGIPDTRGFAEGIVPVISAPWKNQNDAFHASNFSHRPVCVTLPGRIRNITVWFTIPGATHVTQILRRQTGDTARFEITLDGTRAHSLNFILDNIADDALPAVTTVENGKTSRIDAEKIVRIENTFTLPLDGKPGENVQLEIPASATLKSVWANALR